MTNRTSLIDVVLSILLLIACLVYLFAPAVVGAEDRRLAPVDRLRPIRMRKTRAVTGQIARCWKSSTQCYL